MRILVTGMIAGLNDDLYLARVLEMAGIEGLQVKYFNLVRELESRGGKKLPRLLGATNYLFEVLREREYGRIGMALLRNQEKHAIVRVPATIEWNRINLKLKDHKVIAETINPDVIVTLIDAEWTIRERFSKPKTDNPFLGIIKKQHHTIREILSWMNEEVSLAEDWAKYMGVRHYVIPISQHPLSLYKLVKYRDVPSFYVSYSMTHAETEARQSINRTIAKLNHYGLVIDPQAIEIGTEFGSEEEKDATFAYTVHRDLHWFVGKTDACIAIHPYTERPPLSTGMMDELGHARDYLKKRYMIFPPKNLSPFTTDSYIEKGNVFPNEEEFFKKFEEDGYKQLDFDERLWADKWMVGEHE